MTLSECTKSDCHNIRLTLYTRIFIFQHRPPGLPVVHNRGAAGADGRDPGDRRHLGLLLEEHVLLHQPPQGPQQAHQVEALQDHGESVSRKSRAIRTVLVPRFLQQTLNQQADWTVNWQSFYFAELQGWAKEWSLGCVSSRPAARGSQEAGFTQPRDHSLAQPCISTATVKSVKYDMMFYDNTSGCKPTVMSWSIQYNLSQSISF